MFEGIPQEIKQEVEKALRMASRDVYEVLSEAEKLVDKLSAQLEVWADEVAESEQEAGTDDDEPTPEQMYDFLVEHSSDFENEMWSRGYIKNFLISDIVTLEGLYRSKVEESMSPFEAQWGEDWGQK